MKKDFFNDDVLVNEMSDAPTVTYPIDSAQTAFQGTWLLHTLEIQTLSTELRRCRSINRSKYRRQTIN